MNSNRKFEECLTQLEQHRARFVDAQLPDHLRHIEIECLFKLNRLDSAAQQLQTLLRDQPSVSVALNLRHAYVRMGKREHAVAVFRELSDAPWADTTIRLAGSQLLLRESPQEAYRFASQAKELAPDDPAAFSQFLLINTAFLIALQDLRDEHSVKSASGYLRWLYQRFLHTYWTVNPAVQDLVIEQLIQFVTSMVESEKGNHRQMFLAGTASLLAEAPPEFVQLFLRAERTRHLFKDYFGSVVKVAEKIEVPTEDWHQWVVKG